MAPVGDAGRSNGLPGDTGRLTAALEVRLRGPAVMEQSPGRCRSRYLSRAAIRSPLVGLAVNAINFRCNLQGHKHIDFLEPRCQKFGGFPRW